MRRGGESRGGEEERRKGGTYLRGKSREEIRGKVERAGGPEGQRNKMSSNGGAQTEDRRERE